MSLSRKQSGARAEELARAWLERQGYAIVAVNVRFRAGEIDIIAREGKVLCFVEVRSTSSDLWGGPLATISDGKRRRLILAAQLYLQRMKEIPDEVRFDVVSVLGQPDSQPELDLIRGAFTADGYF